MNRSLPVLLLATLAGSALAADEADFRMGPPEVRSISALAFAPEGVLLVGDGKGGAIFALDLADKAPREQPSGHESRAAARNRKVDVFGGRIQRQIVHEDVGKLAALL